MTYVTMPTHTSLSAGGGRRTEVLCVGEALAVTYPEADLSASSSPCLVVQTGGAEANVALHLVAQGIRASWASRIGSDPFGRKVLADLQRGGVDVASVKVDGARPTGMYLKDKRADGSTFMHYYRAGSAATFMQVADVADFRLDEAAWVHFSGITVAISRTAAAMVDALIDTCRERGVRVSFDVNFRPRLWPVAEAAGTLERVAQRADLVFVGLDEASDLWDVSTAEDVFGRFDAPSLIVVKDGNVGASEIDRSGTVPVVTFSSAPSVEVVELIGAGDAFAGGYLAGLIRGENAPSRLRRGHAAAAWTIGSWDDVRPGHQPAPFALTSSEGEP